MKFHILKGFITIDSKINLIILGRSAVLYRLNFGTFKITFVVTNIYFCCYMYYIAVMYNQDFIFFKQRY
jgi:hypothetical protein